jgi:anti-sigma B factor antagonist
MEDKSVLLTINGILNAHTAPDLKQKIEAMIDAGNRKLIVDMSEVEFVDSSGLAAIVSGLKKTHALDGSLVLVGVHPNVMEVFRLTLLDQVFQFYPDLDSALDPA